ncbi:MAG: hypothetical protein IID45_10800 [Planctomycetes bacterium]|nr:hypothetical protein [Planctomycetota bacterium]
MRFIPRKLTMQLTPLLDLLLIVIFAQFMEMRDDSAKAESESTKAQQQTEKKQAARTKKLQTTERDLDKLKKQRDRDRAQAQADRNSLAALRNRLDRQQSADLAKIRLLESHRDLLSRNLAQLFNLPEPALRKMLAPLAAKGAPRTKSDIKKMQMKIRQLAGSRTHQIVRHVVKYEELLKRCDVWEIHFNSRNLLSVSSGEKSHDYRFNIDTLNLPAAKNEKMRRLNRRKLQEYKRELQAEITQHLFTYYTSLPQTKNYVILLLSREAGMATVTDYDVIKLAIEQMAERVRNTTQRKVVVLYADLGELRYDRPAAK